jgi:hypothetical protein
MKVQRKSCGIVNSFSNPGVHDGLDAAIVVRTGELRVSGFIVCTCRFFPYSVPLYFQSNARRVPAAYQ